MKVAVVVSNLKMGGMERVAVNLADAYYDAGHDSHLIYFKDRNRELSPKNHSLPVHLFNLKKGSFLTGFGIIWFTMCKLINAIFSHTFPILFAHLQSIVFKRKLQQLEQKNGTFDLIIFRGQGTFEQIWPVQDPRFVYVCENVQKPNHYGFLSTLIFNKLFRYRKVACVSDGALSSFIELTQRYNIEIKSAHKVSNPNDLQYIKLQAQPSNSKLHNKPYILGLGRLVPQKNFSLLIEAFYQLKRQHHIKHDLVIVGAGCDRVNIETKAKELGIADSVHFKGQQANPYPWFHQAELFVLSSKHEGLGMVLVEALACKTKIVATDCKGGVRDIMNGFFEQFLSKETPDSLAQTMLKALNTPFDEHYQHQIDLSLEQFNGRTITEQFINLYSIKVK